MKYKGFLFQLTAAALSLSLLSACGTSHMSDSETSASNLDNWNADISTMTTAETTAAPEPSQPDTPGQEVTGDYKDQFVGVWDNPEDHETWTFRETETLIISEADELSPESYTYWFEENGDQVLLNIFENGDDDPDKYTFAFSGKNLTLYDPITGEAEESLVWKGETAETPTPAPEATPTATAAATQTPEPPQTTAPTQAPANSPVPQPEPSTEIQLPDNIQLPTEVDKALPMVECALDAVLDGMEFDPTDPAFFWAAMGRYLSRRTESSEEYFTVSDRELEETADDMFDNFDDDLIPNPAESGGLAEKTEGGYRLRWGVTGGHQMELVSFDGISTMELSADGDTYRVILDEGEIVSIEKL